ncbi:MAG: hypothetical protein H7066_23400, partial [Cytophagaceae bacterium]|nr:hypothetical protein [Gemmatimonadaceae bacterium]
AQVAGGVCAGGVLVALLTFSILGALSLQELSLLVLYSFAMLLVCLLACVLPTRRALRVQPTVALREEA